MGKNLKTILYVLFASCFILLTSIVAYAEDYNPANTDGLQLATVPETGSYITVNKDPNTGEWKAYSNGMETPYTGLASNEYGTWYCDSGKVDFSYSGIVEYGGEKWLVQEGKVNYGLDGEYSDNGFINYTLVGGRVEKTGLTQDAQHTLTIVSLFAIALAGILWSKRSKKKQKQKTTIPKPVTPDAPQPLGYYSKQGSEIPKDYYKRPSEASPPKPKVKVVAKPKSSLTAEEAAEGSADLPYRKKYLLTKNEYRFYKSLRPIADTLGLDVLAKIRMGDLVQPLPNWNKSEWYTQWGRVKSRHVDFALVDPASMYVKLLIELDDASHNDTQAKETDQFKNDVYASAGYKLLRVRNEHQLEEKIRFKLKE